MWIGIISLFPEMFRAITDYGITGRAVKNGLLHFNFWNPRNFSKNKYHRIDDHPYGGGSGMLMQASPLLDAIHAAKRESKKKEGKYTTVIYLTPHGCKLNQKKVKNFSNAHYYLNLIFVCGRYKGIDYRLIKKEIDEEWSIGDYVLSGGELAAMIMIDSISRLIPGVLGNNYSVLEDSYSKGLLECPYYTRPKIFENMEVPSILLKGNHSEIRKWRIKQSLGFTWIRHPKLLENLILTDEQKKLLNEFINEYSSSRTN